MPQSGDRPTFLCIGRNGDILNALPLCWDAHERGLRPRMIVGRQWAGMLSGASYVEPMVFDGDYTEVREAIQWAHSQGVADVTVCQFYRNPFDQRRFCSSYQKESWRIAGRDADFGRYPLVLDQRDQAREAQLKNRAINSWRGPVIVLALKGISSPLPWESQLRKALVDRFGAKATLVDASAVVAEQAYDLAGLIDAADLLVTIDSLYLHLARLTCTPVVAILQDGWRSSVPPPQVVAAQSYATGRPEDVVAAVERALARWVDDVLLVVDAHGNTPRHARARETHPANTLRVLSSSIPRFRTILRHALERAGEADAIVWTNSDVQLAPHALTTIRRHLRRFDFCCCRRVEPGQTATHIGRELFAFRADWLRRNIDRIPDVYLATERFDLAVADWLRAELGIRTTMRNLAWDFPPVELTPGLAIHEPHESSWLSRSDTPETAHNLRLYPLPT